MLIQLLAHAGHGDGLWHEVFHRLADPIALAGLAVLLAVGTAGVFYRRSRRWRR